MCGTQMARRFAPSALPGPSLDRRPLQGGSAAPRMQKRQPACESGGVGNSGVNCGERWVGQTAWSRVELTGQPTMAALPVSGVGSASWPSSIPLWHTPHPCRASPLPPNVKWEVRLLTPPPKACAFSAKEVPAPASLFSCGRPASPRGFQAPFLWQSPGLYRDPYSMGNPSFRTVVWLQAWYVCPPTNQLLRTSPDLMGPGTNAASSEKSSCIPSQLRQDGSPTAHTLHPVWSP